MDRPLRLDRRPTLRLTKAPGENSYAPRRIGHHYHIAGAYLLRYAKRQPPRVEWRSSAAAFAMKRKQSVDFTGYWQRHIPA
jgi:hypothetical protein